MPGNKIGERTFTILKYAVMLSILYILGREFDSPSGPLYFVLFIVPFGILGTGMLYVVIEEIRAMYQYYKVK